LTKSTFIRLIKERKWGNEEMKSFYHFALTYRGAQDDKGHFAEAMFNDLLFPKTATDFDELSAYIEMQANADLSTYVFDELWEIYASKYSL